MVVATDGTRACELLEHTIPGPSWRGTNCLYFAASEPPVKGAFLVLDADRDGPLNQMIVMSEVSPDYAPPGQALVSATIIGMERGLGQVRAVMEQLSLRELLICDWGLREGVMLEVLGLVEALP